MQEDKRVLKTKKNLKQTLIKMLAKKSFEKISVKEICEVSQTSRITFYAHYKDKYDLVDDISKDMIKMAQDEYYRLQDENNVERDSITSYCNFLDCILNIYYNNLQLFSHTVPHENPYLNYSFYKYILKYLEIHAQKRSNTLKPKYGLKKTAAFLCYGFLEFINESNIEKNPSKKVRKEVRELLENILKSEILTENILK